MTSPRTRLGEILIERGLLTDRQLDAALREQGRCGERLGQVLVRQGAIEREDLSSALGEQSRRWFAAGLTAGFLVMHPGGAVARTSSAQLSVSVQVLASAVVTVQPASAKGAQGDLSLTCGGGPVMQVTYQRAHIEPRQAGGATYASPYVPDRPAYLLRLRPLGQSVVSCATPGQSVGVKLPAVSLQGDQMNVEIAY